MTHPADQRRRARAKLLRFLKRGGVLVKETYAGFVSWTSAARTGVRFEADVVDRLQATGCKIAGVRHQLVPAGPADAVRLEAVADA